MKYELRTAARVTVPHLCVRYRGETRDLYGNLSVGGIGFFAGHAMAEGEDVEVLFEDPDTGAQLSLHARVLHVEAVPAKQGACYAGARFSAPDVLTEGSLSRYVEEKHALHRLRRRSRAA